MAIPDKIFKRKIRKLQETKVAIVKQKQVEADDAARIYKELAAQEKQPQLYNNEARESDEITTKKKNKKRKKMDTKNIEEREEQFEEENKKHKRKDTTNVDGGEEQLKEKNKKHKKTDTTNDGEGEEPLKEKKKKHMKTGTTNDGEGEEQLKEKKKKHKKTDTTNDGEGEEQLKEIERKKKDPIKDDEPVFQDPESALAKPQEPLEIMSRARFDSLEGIGDKTLKALNEMGFTTMTRIQAETLPTLLLANHLVGAAKTGSGKTLAFLIGAVELAYKVKYKPRNGTAVIILSPTRELSIQTFSVLQQLMKYHSQTCGLVMGGARRQNEVRKLLNGVNILVTTPGRLLDHMRNTPDFVFKNVGSLIVDETDRMFEFGFMKEMKEIISLLPDFYQKVLFSATQNENSDAMTSLVFKNSKDFVRVSCVAPGAAPTVTGLKQMYCDCPWDKRLSFLWSFIKLFHRRKIMVFFNSVNSVEFHGNLFNFLSHPVMFVHGKQKQNDRLKTFFRFNKVTSGTLFCTDVAARGWDIPGVDWIIQYDPPSDIQEYIHRVGRAARGEGATGQALVFLTHAERNFVGYLKEDNIPLTYFEIFWDNIPISRLQPSFETVIGRNFLLNKLAIKAYQGFVRSYISLRDKHVFDINQLDLNKICAAFGFRKPPRVDFGNPTLNKRLTKS